jgi:sugar (glycoside-pentoside-hexuronide) transporter
MENTKKKFMPMKEILAYSMGLFGLQAIVFYLNSYQAEFYNMAMGADFTIIAFILLAGKVASAVFDPFVGNMIEKREKGKIGKLKPFIYMSIIPLIVLTILIFIPINFKNSTLMYIYIFVTYTIWCMAMTLGDVPSQGIGAVLTPDPEERTNMLTIANTLKSIGKASPFVFVLIICLIVPGGAGFEGLISKAEYIIGAIFIALVGAGLFALTGLSTKERVPYKSEHMSFKDMFTALKNNKPLLLVMLSYILGFAREAAMAIQLQAANAILGGANKILLLGITAAIGTMLSMTLTPLLIKKFDEKKVFLGMSIYGFFISIATFLVGYQTLWLMLIFLFLLGFQFGAVNIMPMIMVADSVDYYEWKTGKRTEGVAYAVLSFSIKIALAMGAAVAIALIGVFGYSATETVFTESVKKGVYFTYTVVPGITSLLAAIPIFFYDLRGDKKKQITRELAERREAANATENSVEA